MANDMGNSDAFIVENLWRWQDAVAAYTNYDGDFDHPVFVQLVDNVAAIEAEIVSSPANTSEGLAIKMFMMLRLSDEVEEHRENPWDVKLPASATRLGSVASAIRADALRFSPTLRQILKAGRGHHLPGDQPKAADNVTSLPH